MLGLVFGVGGDFGRQLMSFLAPFPIRNSSDHTSRRLLYGSLKTHSHCSKLVQSDESNLRPTQRTQRVDPAARMGLRA